MAEVVNNVKSFQLFVQYFTILVCAQSLRIFQKMIFVRRNNFCCPWRAGYAGGFLAKSEHKTETTIDPSPLQSRNFFIDFCQGPGGETMLVDGFYAAQILKQRHPHMYRCALPKKEFKFPKKLWGKTKWFLEFFFLVRNHF